MRTTATQCEHNKNYPTHPTAHKEYGVKRTDGELLYDMQSWRLPSGTITFAMTNAVISEHVHNKYALPGEPSGEPSGQEYPGADDRDQEWWNGGEGINTEINTEINTSETKTEASYEFQVWWWQDSHCDGIDCNCGRITLLEVLERLPPKQREMAVKLHAEEMHTLFSHFWAGQGIASGTSDTVGEACAGCIGIGSAHVWDVYASACTLAEEFGETLAAYAYELRVGEPRFPTSTA